MFSNDSPTVMLMARPNISLKSVQVEKSEPGDDFHKCVIFCVMPIAYVMS